MRHFSVRSLRAAGVSLQCRNASSSAGIDLFKEKAPRSAKTVNRTRLLHAAPARQEAMYPDFDDRDVHVARESSTAASTSSSSSSDATYVIVPIVIMCVIIAAFYYWCKRFYQRCCWRTAAPVMVVQAPAPQPVVNVNVVGS
ncbi:hypothetical protein MTO96_052021 [Rhipicephalus appendiculatus]